MPGTPPPRAVAWLSIFLAGCGAAPLAPITGATVVRDEHEDALWKRSAEVHERLVKAGALDRDSDAERHLRTIASDLVPRLGAPGFAIHPFVLRTSDPIATSFADGHVYVSMGMLALLESDDELAFVLGHEIAHVVRRHAAGEDRAARRGRSSVTTVTDVIAASLAVATLNPGVYAAMHGLTDPVGEHALFSHLSAYSQALEYDADARGTAAAIEAGYDPEAGVHALERFDLFVTDELPDRRERYATHPQTSARIDRLRGLGGTATTAGDPTRYRAVVLPYLPVVTGWHLSVGRRREAQRTADRYVSWAPQSAEGYCLRGEVLRTAPAAENLTANAIAAYERCARLDPDRANAQRELGLLYRATGRRSAARDAFTRYLQLAPDAVDRGIIEAYRAEVGGAP